MKRAALGTVVVVALLAATQVMASAADPKTLILVIDGCRPDALQQVMAAGNAPNTLALTASGAASYTATDSMTAGNSGANYSSMLTGVGTAKHGVTTNAMGSNGLAGNHFDIWPNIFYRLETWNPALYTASYPEWGDLNPGVLINGVADAALSGSGAQNASRAATLLQTGDPDLLFVQFEGVDSAGHSGGWTNPDGTFPSSYLSAIHTVDTYVGTVLAALHARPGWLDGSEDWLVILTSDHGGVGYAHDILPNPDPNIARQVYTVPYIIAGPDVPVGADIGSPQIYDVAVSSLEHLGFRTDGLGLDGHLVLPEPATLGLLALGGLGALLRRKRR